MPKSNRYLTKYVEKNLLNKIKSIEYPIDVKNRYFITLKFPIPIDPARGNEIFSKLCDRLRYKYKEVCGIYVKEYHNESLHFHLILVDYATTRQYFERSIQAGGLSTELTVSEVADYISKQWRRLNEEDHDFDLGQFDIKIGPFYLNQGEYLDKKLEDYIIKARQKEIPLGLDVRHSWYGVLNKRAMRFKAAPLPITTPLPLAA